MFASELPQASPAPPLLVVISGPSGAGKGSVLAELKKLERPWHHVVTATTRPMRAGEVDGKDYIFLDVDTFLRMRERDELLESAQVYDRWYGVPRQQVRDPLIAGRDVILGDRRPGRGNHPKHRAGGSDHIRDARQHGRTPQPPGRARHRGCGGNGTPLG